jgi:hypothetical protein
MHRSSCLTFRVAGGIIKMIIDIELAFLNADFAVFSNVI